MKFTIQDVRFTILTGYKDSRYCRSRSKKLATKQKFINQMEQEQGLHSEGLQGFEVLQEIGFLSVG